MILLFAAFFLIGCKKGKSALQNTDTKNDSLELYLREANNDSLQYQKRFEYAKKAEGIVLAGENDSLNRVNLFRVANRYYNLRDLDIYKTIVEEIVKKSYKAKDTLNVAKGFSYKGDYFKQKCFPDSSYKYYDKAQKLYFKMENKEVYVSEMLLNKTVVRFEERDFIGSQKSAFDALRFLKKKNDPEIRYDTYNILGAIFNELNDFSKSLEYNHKALDIALSEFDDEDRIFNSFHNIGLTYQNNNDDKKAIQFFEKALETKGNYPNTLRHSILIDNLGYSKLRLREFDDLPHLFFKSLKISDSLKLERYQISSKIHLSQYYLVKRDTIRAKFYAHQAYLNSKTFKIPKYKLLSLKELINIDYKNAKKHSQEYIRIDDSLQLSERKNINKFARIEYETEELTLEKDKLVEQRKTILYIASATLFILILILLFWYQKSRSREMTFIKEQQKANEEIYKLILDQQQKLEEGKQIEKKRISKELHDGVMGRLTSIRLNLFVLSRKSDVETISKCLDHIQEIQEVEKEIRTIAYDLGKNLFSDNINFETVVKNIFKAIENHSEINFRLYIDENIDWERINGANKIQIYRILQESLQNMDKYSQAKNVIVSMKKINETITIEVNDDGIGFDKKKIKKGFGLKNMKERAQEINAKIRVTSEPGNGTKVSLTIPIK